MRQRRGQLGVAGVALDITASHRYSDTADLNRAEANRRAKPMSEDKQKYVVRLLAKHVVPRKLSTIGLETATAS